MKNKASVPCVAYRGEVVYIETFPDDCDNTNIRRVIELRDVVQKEKLQRHTAGNLEKLIAAVQSAQKIQ